MAEKELVRFEKVNGIGVITVDNPPVNALSTGVPEGIVAAVDKGNADPAVKAMVLIGAGRSFIAGADIRQFGREPSAAPSGRRPYDVLDDSAKPVVAAIHGYALGGGLEIALEIITSGRHVAADEALRLGIVDEIVPEAELKGAAIAFARRVAEERPL